MHKKLSIPRNKTKCRFSVITVDTQSALNVKRVIEQLDPNVNVLRLGCKLDFWTNEPKIDKGTFTTMSYISHVSIITPTKDTKNVESHKEISRIRKRCSSHSS